MKSLQRRNVVLMIAFTVLTFGFYYPIWFLRRRAALNRLDSPRKLPVWPFLVLLAFLLVNLAVAVIDGGRQPGTGGTGDSLLFLIARFGVGILMVIQSFGVKDILEDHLAGTDTTMPAMMRGAVTLSGVLTFIFSIFYLQHAINTNIDALAASPSAVT